MEGLNEMTMGLKFFPQLFLTPWHFLSVLFILSLKSVLPHFSFVILCPHGSFNIRLLRWDSSLSPVTTTFRTSVRPSNLPACLPFIKRTRTRTHRDGTKPFSFHPNVRVFAPSISSTLENTVLFLFSLLSWVFLGNAACPLSLHGCMNVYRLKYAKRSLARL
jgi:hypothetical protein